MSLRCSSDGVVLRMMQLDDKAWVDSVVEGEDIVQREDMHMCDLVQSGLTSPAYDVGRCGPPERLLS